MGGRNFSGFDWIWEAASARFRALGTIGKWLEALLVPVDSRSQRVTAQRIAAEYLFLAGFPYEH